MNNIVKTNGSRHKQSLYVDSWSKHLIDQVPVEVLIFNIIGLSYIITTISLKCF